MASDMWRRGYRNANPTPFRLMCTQPCCWCYVSLNLSHSPGVLRLIITNCMLRSLSHPTSLENSARPLLAPISRVFSAEPADWNGSETGGKIDLNDFLWLTSPSFARSLNDRTLHLGPG